MSRFTDVLADFARSALTSLRRSPKPPRTPPRAPSGPRPPEAAPGAPVSPGQSGPSATLEVRAATVGPVTMTFNPVTDGDPDPGEIVWTWVPYEENDGRGKDRPVLIVAAESSGTVLAVQLTSKNHSGDGDFVAIGSGSWDGEHRPSWVNLDRVFRVYPGGMRREAAALGRDAYDRVAQRLRDRYAWS